MFLTISPNNPILSNILFTIKITCLQYSQIYINN